jgi:hypothetical protein
MEKVIVGLRELERNIESDVGRPEDVDVDIKDIVSVLEGKTTLRGFRKYTPDELIDQLETSLRLEKARSNSTTDIGK